MNSKVQVKDYDEKERIDDIQSGVAARDRRLQEAAQIRHT